MRGRLSVMVGTGGRNGLWHDARESCASTRLRVGLRTYPASSRGAPPMPRQVVRQPTTPRSNDTTRAQPTSRTALGITPTNALQHIIVIDGKATADAQLIGMLVRRAGHRLEDKTTTETSTVTITRADDGSVHTVTFTMQDAARAGLSGKANWKNYP